MTAETSLIPRRTRIKFCGLTRTEDVLEAGHLGVDAIGLIFATGSPRRLALEQGARLRRAIPPLVSVVALLRDPGEREVRATIAAIQPHFLQFHGDESAAFCASFGLPYLKAIAMGDAPEAFLQRAAPHVGPAAALLLDGHAPGAAGGQGVRFDWTVLREPERRANLPPLIVAGGLTPGNVQEAIRIAQPFAVDVSSGIEGDLRAAPGCKDSGRMRAFVRAVREADAAIEA